MKWTKYTALFLIVFWLTAPLSAQIIEAEAGALVEILTADGNNYRGKVVSITGSAVEIETSNLGVITINKEDIKRLRKVDSENQEVDKKGYPIDYHGSTHYLVNPSGYTLKEDQSYYQNIGFFFNTYSVGITDRFTLSMGGEIASILFGGRIPILYISPRYSLPVKNDKLSVSLGATLFTSPQDDFVGFGVMQTAITFGDRNNNFTLGVGIGFSTSDGFSNTVIPFYPSFMIRVSEKISFVSDNFLISYDNFDGATAVLSAAVRVHFQKRNGSSMDFGLWRPTEGFDEVVALPFVGATVALK